jgi:transcriptional regulator with PAS, ATPase and Fis domain
LQLAGGLSGGSIIQPVDIHFMQMMGGQAELAKLDTGDIELPEQISTHAMSPVEQYEAGFITSLIKKYQGNRKLIAAEMNISERTLYRKLNRLNLN